MKRNKKLMVKGIKSAFKNFLRPPFSKQMTTYLEISFSSQKFPFCLTENQVWFETRLGKKYKEKPPPPYQVCKCFKIYYYTSTNKYTQTWAHTHI